jgi:hypothetical protein
MTRWRKQIDRGNSRAAVIAGVVLKTRLRAGFQILVKVDRTPLLDKLDGDDDLPRGCIGRVRASPSVGRRQPPLRRATSGRCGQGPITFSRIARNLAVSDRKPPDRDSVPACPDLPFVDALTAQFATVNAG